MDVDMDDENAADPKERKPGRQKAETRDDGRDEGSSSTRGKETDDLSGQSRCGTMLITVVCLSVWGQMGSMLSLPVERASTGKVPWCPLGLDEPPRLIPTSIAWPRPC